MSNQNNNSGPSPKDYGVLGISCGYGKEAVDVTKEYSQLPKPNGKHRWKYKCYDPETGEKGETNYTEWIYD